MNQTSVRINLPEGTALPRILDTDETTSYLHISKATLFVLLKEGALRGFKVGRRRMFTEAELADFIVNRASA